MVASDAKPARGSRRLDAICVGTVTMDRLGARAVMEDERDAMPTKAPRASKRVGNA